MSKEGKGQLPLSAENLMYNAGNGETGVTHLPDVAVKTIYGVEYGMSLCLKGSPSLTLEWFTKILMLSIKLQKSHLCRKETQGPNSILKSLYLSPKQLLLGPVVNIKPTAVEESLSVLCPEDIEQLETLDGRPIDGLFSSRPLRLFEPREWSTLLEEQRALELKGKGHVEEWKIVTGAVTWSGKLLPSQKTDDDVTLPESPSAVSTDKAWLVFLASSSPVLLVTGYT
ncbi:hypothetical protein K435DRAFT_934429 [Dendrothele bispora CBS 962.96]|uniref:Uncharacterized protein n=1 Tax=Dendrothele bispora (strain CBS 962.96) TaxID=1314807 RepID=A0A4S8L1D6_DENBC|nr:hypothetical protein K435DRAFT_934429 [Dendrothele bispora CBS 962.96]